MWVGLGKGGRVQSPTQLDGFKTRVLRAGVSEQQRHLYMTAWCAVASSSRASDGCAGPYAEGIPAAPPVSCTAAHCYPAVGSGHGDSLAAAYHGGARALCPRGRRHSHSGSSGKRPTACCVSAHPGRTAAALWLGKQPARWLLGTGTLCASRGAAAGGVHRRVSGGGPGAPASARGARGSDAARGAAGVAVGGGAWHSTAHHHICCRHIWHSPRDRWHGRARHAHSTLARTGWGQCSCARFSRWCIGGRQCRRVGAAARKWCSRPCGAVRHGRGRARPAACGGGSTARAHGHMALGWRARRWPASKPDSSVTHSGVCAQGARSGSPASCCRHGATAHVCALLIRGCAAWWRRPVQLQRSQLGS